MVRRAKREVLFTISDDAAEPRYMQIYRQARLAIEQGTLKAGEKLPSIRKLCDALGVSHTTVEQAYLQLAVEGYVHNVPRSGYVVEKLDVKFLQLPKATTIEANIQRAVQSRNIDAFYAENASGSAARYDFSYANLPPDSFPVREWRRLVADVLYANTAPDMARYGYTHEPNALRREIAAYLSRARGVNCMPDSVLVQAGTDGALATVLQLFDRNKHVIGMEEPGYATVHEVAARMGFTLVPLPVTRDHHEFLAALDEYKPKLVFCTPSHQFPMGHVMHMDARTRLLRWAQRHDAYIIEDDSCNEYRYDTAPIPSLQSLDAYSRVIYLCNFSKALSPALRAAYLVLPPKLLGRYFRMFNYAHPSMGHLEAEVLARFMESGGWDAHVRRMASTMKQRHDLLLSALEEQMGNHIEISGKHSGMHLYVGVNNGMTQDELLASARREGATVYGTRRMWFSKFAPEHYLMIGFSSIDPDDIAPGVAALSRAWFAK